MVPHIADEGCAVTLAFQLEEDVPGRMARCGIDFDKLVEPVRAAAHQIGLPMLENGDDAFAERTEFGRTFFRVGINL